MAQNSLKCPSCGAPQQVDDLAGKTVLTCPYCQNSFPVTQQKGSPVQIKLDMSRMGLNVGKLIRTIVIGSVISVLVFVGIFCVVCSQVGKVAENMAGKGVELAKHAKRVGSTTTPQRREPMVADKPDEPAKPESNVELKFGAKGKGPGQINDPRSLAVDREGNIFVGERGGRLQKFDAKGKFVQQIDVDPCNDHTDMVADYVGQLYVTCGGDIRQHKTSDGSLVRQIKSRGRAYYRYLAMHPTNTLYVFNHEFKNDSVLKIKPGGRIAGRWNRLLSGVRKSVHPSAKLAVAADGTVYALGMMQSRVYVFTPEGKFNNQWRPYDVCKARGRPRDFAIDGEGRLYFAGSREIAVCNGDGAPVGKISLPVHGVRALTVDLKGAVYLVTYGGSVLKVRPKL